MFEDGEFPWIYPLWYFVVKISCFSQNACSWGVAMKHLQVKFRGLVLATKFPPRKSALYDIYLQLAAYNTIHTSNQVLPPTHHTYAHTHTQLTVKSWRKPLVMGNQCSEMKANYQGKTDTISNIISHAGNPQPPTLADHFVEGPTKVCTCTLNIYLKNVL